MKKLNLIPQRAYKGRDIEMLTSINVLVNLLLQKEAELAKAFTNWKPPFFKNLLIQIDAVVKKYIGVNNAKSLRQATTALEQIQTNALADLTSFRTQINRLIKDKVQLQAYLTDFGFDAYYEDAKVNKSQPSLVNLLFQVDKNIDATTQAALISKNVQADLITRLKGYATTLYNANVKQEDMKKVKPASTAEAVNAFNDIYKQVMDVVVISSDFYKEKDKVLSKQLTYASTLRAQKILSTNPDENQENPTPNPPKK